MEHSYILKGIQETRYRRFRVLNNLKETYTLDDVMKFTEEDYRRIESARASQDTQEFEYAFFFTMPVVQMVLEQRLAARVRKIRDWRDAEKRGRLKDYFSGQGRWPDRGIVEGVAYSGDLFQYYSVRGIQSWQEALEKGVIHQYFAGQEYFPAIDNYEIVDKAEGIDEYIMSLTDDQYLQDLSKYSVDLPTRYEKYDTPLSFVRVAMSQLELYTEVLSTMKEPIYIPGDGLGLGSIVCRMLGKQYVSSEPNSIGDIAIKKKIITEKDSYQYKEECNSVFFGNVLLLLHSDVVFDWLDRGKQVEIVEKSGICCSDYVRKKDPDTKIWLFPTSRVEWWSSISRHIVVLDMNYFRSDQPKIFFPRDRLAENMLTRLYLSTHYVNDQLAKLTSKKARLLMTNYPKFIGLAKKQRQAYEWWAVGIKFSFVPVVTKDVGEFEEHDISFFTRSYVKDRRHGRVGSAKLVEDTILPFVPNQPRIYCDGWRKMTLESYERADILEKYSTVGTAFVSLLYNPLSKKFIEMAGKRVKIILVGYNEKTHEATYKLASTFAYEENEEKEGFE